MRPGRRGSHPRDGAQAPSVTSTVDIREADAGDVLLELRPADTGGLEELLLSLTSSGREEALIS